MLYPLSYGGSGWDDLTSGVGAGRNRQRDGRRSVGGTHAGVAGLGDRLGPGTDLELGQDRGDPVADGLLGEEQPPRDGRVVRALGDEAAMRLGETSSDEYLAGWTRTEWTSTVGNATDVCDRVVAELEEQWPPERLAAYLDTLGQ